MKTVLQVAKRAKFADFQADEAAILRGLAVRGGSPYHWGVARMELPSTTVYASFPGRTLMFPRIRSTLGARFFRRELTIGGQMDSVRKWTAGMRRTAIGITLGLWLVGTVQAGTFVRFDTSLGAMSVELFDAEVPITVANFLSYVDSGRYEGSFIHRSIGGPVPPAVLVLGGGYTFDSATGQSVIVPTFPPIIHETGRMNLRGTLAMSRSAVDLNSATSQWFFNVSDNDWLDTPDNEFTVFGRVVGQGLAVVDAMAAVPRFNFGGPFSEIPVRDYTPGSVVTAENLILIDQIVRIPPPPVLIGDANGDCLVGSADYALWAAQFGRSEGPLSADFDGNGNVGAADYTLWAANFGATCPPTSAVPEPSGWWLAVEAGCLAAVVSWWRRVAGCRRGSVAKAAPALSI